MSADHSFIIDCSIIGRLGKTIKYIDQSDNSSECVFGFNTSRISRLLTDWTVENITLEVAPYRMLLEFPPV